MRSPDTPPWPLVCRHCQKPIMYVANRPLDGNGHWEHGSSEVYPHGMYLHCRATMAEPETEQEARRSRRKRAGTHRRQQAW